MVLLLIIALILAWPTTGLSLIAYFALVFLRRYLEAKIRRRRANTIMAIREVQAGKGHPPSWVNDSTRSSAFIGATISEATRKGVPRSFITNHFKSDENKAVLICLVGLMEDKGASIREQGIAATDFICEIWKIQNSDVTTKLRAIRELLEKRRALGLIKALNETDGFDDLDDSLFGIDKEVVESVKKCMGMAEEICSITGQDVKDVLTLAARHPI